jgi:phospholipase C
VATTINRLQTVPEWRSTAVLIAYDDSDGWYDHVMRPIVNEDDGVPSDRDDD